MNKGQINQLNMAETVEQVFYDVHNINLWNGNPAISAAVVKHKSFVDAINQLSPVQQTNTTGATTTKNDAKDHMADLAYAAASAGKSYAHTINDTVLFAKMNVTISDITGAADNVGDDKAKNIHDALVVAAILPHLANFGATAASLGLLQTAITTFTGFLGQNSNQAAAVTVATGGLATLFTDMMDNLKNQLDPIMVQFKLSNAKFYNHYVAGRLIHNIGHRKTVVIEGWVYNNADPALALAHVLITITGTDSVGNAVILTKHTDADGHFKFTRLNIGAYTVTPSLAEYTALAKTYTFTEPQSGSDDYTLTPVA